MVGSGVLFGNGSSVARAFVSWKMADRSKSAVGLGRDSNMSTLIVAEGPQRGDVVSRRPTAQHALVIVWNGTLAARLFRFDYFRLRIRATPWSVLETNVQSRGLQMYIRAEPTDIDAHGKGRECGCQLMRVNESDGINESKRESEAESGESVSARAPGFTRVKN
jgi:hypothetical protein